MNLPSGWKWCKLRELIELRYGEGLVSSKRVTSGSIPVFGSNGIVGRHDRALTKGPAIILGRKGSVGAVNWSDTPCWPIDTTYYCENFTDRLSAKFVFFFLKSLKLKELDRSTAIPGINRDDLYSLDIPIPPTNEQVRTVSKIEELNQKLNEARDSLSKVPEITKQFRRSILSKAFHGDLATDDSNGEDAKTILREINCYREKATNSKKSPGKSQNQKLRGLDMENLTKLPKGWEWSSLNEVCDVEMGQSPPGSSYNQDGKGVPLLNGPTEFGEEHPKAVQWTTAPSKYCSKGDILICVRGNTTGKMNIADQVYCISRGLGAIRPVNDFVNQKLVFYFLLYATNEIMKRTAGSTFPNLAGEQLKGFPFPLPPRKVQDILAARISDAIANSSSCETQIADIALKLATLERSILVRAFRGELVPQDPNDEPASVLLQRVKS